MPLNGAFFWEFFWVVFLVGAPHRIVLRCTPFPLCQPTFLIFHQISECSHYGQKSKFEIMELSTSKTIAITDNITDKNSKLQCLDKQESTRHKWMIWSAVNNVWVESLISVVVDATQCGSDLRSVWVDFLSAYQPAHYFIPTTTVLWMARSKFIRFYPLPRPPHWTENEIVNGFLLQHCSPLHPRLQRRELVLRLWMEDWRVIVTIRNAKCGLSIEVGQD